MLSLVYLLNKQKDNTVPTVAPSPLNSLFLIQLNPTGTAKQKVWFCCYCCWVSCFVLMHVKEFIKWFVALLDGWRCHVALWFPWMWLPKAHLCWAGACLEAWPSACLSVTFRLTKEACCRGKQPKREIWKQEAGGLENVTLREEGMRLEKKHFLPFFSSVPTVKTWNMKP